MNNQFKNMQQVETAVNNFDFSTLDFWKGENPIFLNTDNGKFDAWIVGTDIETAERQNCVVFVGNLTKANAKKGIKPLGEWEKKHVAAHLFGAC